MPQYFLTFQFKKKYRKLSSEAERGDTGECAVVPFHKRQLRYNLANRGHSGVRLTSGGAPSGGAIEPLRSRPGGFPIAGASRALPVGLGPRS